MDKFKSLLDDVVGELAGDLAEKKEELLREAITYMMGPDWTPEEVKPFGTFVIYSDKREEFVFKGRPLLAFYGVESNTDYDNNKLEARLLYKKLYDEGE